MLRDGLRNDFTLTKRHLGILMIVAGVLLALMMLAVELLGPESAGLGAIQLMGIGGGIAGVLVGLTLIPAEDQLA